jgi:hypothetical protein
MATKDYSPKVCCGDTTACKECPVLAALSESQNGAVAQFTRNALDRCDFYLGPNPVLAPISTTY